jgi:tetratricopeptide (TPR) repeat protein
MSSWFRFTFAMALVALFAPLSICGQSNDKLPLNQPVPALSTVHGVVRDSQSQPVSGVKVFLQDGNRVLTATTDATGAYRFSSVPAGRFTLHAESSGAKTAPVEFVLKQNEDKEIDLALPAQKPTDHPSATIPEFYDEPHFTVAGVTDTTNMGGHGSSVTIIRNTESMVKAAASLSDSSSGKSPLSSNAAQVEAPLRLAAEQHPESFQANYQLGKFLVEEGRPAEAIESLKRAFVANPLDYENHYELALAYCKAADYGNAKSRTESLLEAAMNPEQKADAHHLLGEIDERIGDSLAAVREFQRAAELNPTEPNLFDWGSELLLHRAAEPAIEVFTKGSTLFPGSVRMLTALGAAWFALGAQEKAAQSLCEASDLNPEDPNPYLFMGKIQATEALPSPAIAQRLQRFATLQPQNALANYYYAVSLWKARSSVAGDNALAQTESLLMKSTQLDPKLGEAYLQLGVVYAEEKETSKAVSAYERAIAATPDLAEAHYRLAQSYRQAGEPSKAKAELQQYEKISKEKAEETETERRQIQQFVYQLQQPKAAGGPR